MVLRKPPPPRLENLNRGRARSDSYSPSSPSVNSTSRARLNRVPSQESVYSPDLNTSPAFDLMPLEEAQRSPVASPTTHPPNSWSEGLGERTGDRPATSGSYPTGTNPKSAWVPSALMPGLQGAAETGWQPAPGNTDSTTGEVPVQLQSNNPFLKPRTSDSRQEYPEQNESGNRHSHATTSSDPLSQCMNTHPLARTKDADVSQREDISR